MTVCFMTTNTVLIRRYTFKKHGHVSHKDLHAMTKLLTCNHLQSKLNLDEHSKVEIFTEMRVLESQLKVFTNLIHFTSAA